MSRLGLSCRDCCELLLSRTPDPSQAAVVVSTCNSLRFNYTGVSKVSVLAIGDEAVFAGC